MHHCCADCLEQIMPSHSYNKNNSKNGRGDLNNSLFNLHLIINYFIKTLPRHPLDWFWPKRCHRRAFCWNSPSLPPSVFVLLLCVSGTPTATQGQSQSASRRASQMLDCRQCDLHLSAISGASWDPGCPWAKIYELCSFSFRWLPRLDRAASTQTREECALLP